MSVGTGIFLSSIFLGFIILFVFTKDRWKWKKIALWTVGVLVSLVGVFAGWIYVDSYLSGLPKLQQAYWDIPIAAKKGDVRLLKGKPSQELQELEDRNPTLVYTSGGASYWAAFKGDSLIFVACTAEDSWRCERLQGIGIGDSYREIKDKFGEPSHISISSDELTRMVSYEDYGVFFSLSANKVEVFGMYQPSFGPMEFAQKDDQERSKTAKKTR